MARNVSVDTVTIANGASTSTAVTLPANKRLLGFQTPAALTSTAITFEQSSDDGVTYTPVRAVGGASAYSVTVAASYYVPVSGEVFDGVRVVRLIGGTSEGGARTIRVLLGES